MQIHTHSSSRPWEQGLASPPAKTVEQSTGDRDPVDSFKASSKEKSHFSVLGTGLLALTALTGIVATQPAAAQVMEVPTSPAQEVTTDSLARDGYENPDDWKEDLHGGGHHCAAVPRPGFSQGFEGILKFDGPDAWKADLGGGNYTAPSRNKGPQRTTNPVQTQRTQRQDSRYPDDWKSELGGGDYRPGPSRPKRIRHNQRSQQSQKPERYEGPDSWKEDLGGGSYDYDSGSGSSQSNDWGGPDDWKSEL